MIGYMVLKSFLTIIIGVLFVGLIVLVIVSKGVKNVVNHNAITRVCTGVIIGIFAVIIGFTLIPFGTSEEAVVDGYAQTRTYAQSVKTLSTNVDTFKEEVKKRDEEETAERNGVAKYIYPHVQNTDYHTDGVLDISCDLNWWYDGDGYYGNPTKQHDGTDTNMFGDRDGHNYVEAACAGTVQSAGSNATTFHEVRILDKDGNLWRYLHLNEIDSSIVVGAEVKQGQRLGTVGGWGANGAATYAAHLHLQVQNSKCRVVQPFSLGIFDMRGYTVKNASIVTQYSAETNNYTREINNNATSDLEKYADILPFYMYMAKLKNCDGLTVIYQNDILLETDDINNSGTLQIIKQAEPTATGWGRYYDANKKPVTEPFLPTQGGN